MPTGQEFLQDKPKTSILVCANFGEGKTTLAITFPKFFYVGFRHGGLEVLRQSRNIKYQANLIHYEELRVMFQPEKGKINTIVREAAEMAKRGEVETLVVDDGTDAVENMQKYVWEFDK